MLLWIDGFDNYGTTTGAAPSPTGIVGQKYSVIAYENLMDIETGRFSGYGLELNGTGCYFQPAALTTNATMIIGFAVKFGTLANAAFLQLYDGATLGVNIRTTTNGEIAIYRGTTLLGTTSGLGLLINTWYYVELKVFCDNAGSYDLHVGEVSVKSASPVDTQVTNPYHTTFRFVDTGGVTLIDDLYCLDGSGAINNDFLGNMRVTTLRPDANGDSADFTPSTGDNYTCVDEVIMNTTDYVEDDTGAQKDLYNYGGISASPTLIAGVQVSTDCCETDANSFSLITPCKSGSRETDNVAQAVASSSYVTKHRILETDPDTGVNATAVLDIIAANGDLTFTSPADGYNGTQFITDSVNAESVTYVVTTDIFTLNYDDETSNGASMKTVFDAALVANPTWPQWDCADEGDGSGVWVAGDDGANVTSANGVTETAWLKTALNAAQFGIKVG